MSKPLDTETLQRRGSWKAAARRNAGKDAPVVHHHRPEPPPTLSEGAREKWDWLVGVMDEMGSTGVGDIETMERYCELSVQWRDVCDRVNAEGMVYQDRHGKFYKSPHAVLLVELTTKLTSLGGLLGLSPVDRLRLRVDVKSKNPGSLDPSELLKVGPRPRKPQPPQKI